MATAQPADGTSVEEQLRSLVADHRREWFGEAHGRGDVRVRILSTRPRCTLYALTIGPGAVPHVVAKVRQRAEARPPGRPTLAPSPASAAELTRLEFDALSAIERCVRDDDRFRAVRPLALAPEHDALLMDYVEAPTLRNRLLADSRINRPAPHDGAVDTWRSAGAWLALLRATVDHAGRPARQGTREAVVAQVEAYGRFLAGQLGAGAVDGVAERAARTAAHLLPERLELAVGHGDYAPRNLFALPGGRVAVFDPLFRWAVPRYEDLGRFLVGIRMSGLQLHSHGAAYGARRVEALEEAVLEGYAERGELDLAELRCYELLVLLDKWAALTASSRGRMRRTSLRLASRYVRQQAQRLLELAELA